MEAAPKHFFSADFVVRASGRSVTTLDLSPWRERAEFELDGVTYRLSREGLLRGDFLLERGGVAIARATKPNPFRARFELDLGGRHLVLRRTSWFGHRFGLFAGDAEVGAITRMGVFSRRMRVDLPADLPVPLQLFALWLALVIRRRQRRAAAS